MNGFLKYAISVVPWWSSGEDSAMSLLWPRFNPWSWNRNPTSSGCRPWQKKKKKKKKKKKALYLYNGILFVNKKNQVLIHTTIWIQLKHYAKWKSQTQQTIYLWFHLYEMSRTGKSIGADSLELPRTRGKKTGRNGKWLLMGTGLLFGVMNMF